MMGTNFMNTHKDETSYVKDACGPQCSGKTSSVDDSSSAQTHGHCSAQHVSLESCAKAALAQLPAPWISTMLNSAFFVPCEAHKHMKKNECTYFCATCANASKPLGLCQHCMADHCGHQSLQIRRYVYCDVVRCSDINQHVDVNGIQAYIINQAKVVFLNVRPQAKIGRPSEPDSCRNCSRNLREGFSYCCLACKVDAIHKGIDDGPAPALMPCGSGSAAAAASPAAAAAAAAGGLRHQGSLMSALSSDTTRAFLTSLPSPPPPLQQQLPSSTSNSGSAAGGGRGRGRSPRSGGAGLSPLHKKKRWAVAAAAAEEEEEEEVEEGCGAVAAPPPPETRSLRQALFSALSLHGYGSARCGGGGGPGSGSGSGHGSGSGAGDDSSSCGEAEEGTYVEVGGQAGMLQQQQEQQQQQYHPVQMAGTKRPRTLTGSKRSGLAWGSGSSREGAYDACEAAQHLALRLPAHQQQLLLEQQQLLGSGQQLAWHDMLAAAAAAGSGQRPPMGGSFLMASPPPPPLFVVSSSADIEAVLLQQQQLRQQYGSSEDAAVERLYVAAMQQQQQQLLYSPPSAGSAPCRKAALCSSSSRRKQGAPVRSPGC